MCQNASGENAIVNNEVSGEITVANSWSGHSDEIVVVLSREAVSMFCLCQLGKRNYSFGMMVPPYGG